MKKRIKYSPDAVADALFPATKKLIIELFFSYPADSFYLNDIFKRIGGGRSTIQNTLASFTESGILLMERKGKYTYYNANQSSPFFAELVSIVNKGLAYKINRAIKGLNGIKVAFVYGSVAKATAKTRSDVDLMVIGYVKFGDVVRSLSNLQLRLKREINPSVISPEEFKDRINREDHFIESVIKGKKVLVTGDDNELKSMVECGSH